MREALFHDVPDRPGHAAYDIELASSELPNGAAWLVNCLLELGVSAWKPWGADDRAHWQHLGGLRYRYVGGDNGWSRVLPALSHGREFAFRATPCLRAHHTWPGVFPAARHLLLFVRDPCDALHSAWQRLLRLEMVPAGCGFAEFCRRPFHHFPIAWQDYLLLHLRVWRMAVARERSCIVRFEDYRRDAAATLRRVLDYIGLDADADAVQRAVAASSVEKVKAEDERLYRSGVVASRIVRGEAPGGHLRHLDAPETAAVAERFADVCEWLGYAAAPARAPAAATPRDAHLHAAMLDALRRSGIRVDEDGWLAAAVGDSLHGIDFADPA